MQIFQPIHSEISILNAQSRQNPGELSSNVPSISIYGLSAYPQKMYYKLCHTNDVMLYKKE